MTLHAGVQDAIDSCERRDMPSAHLHMLLRDLARACPSWGITPDVLTDVVMSYAERRASRPAPSTSRQEGQ